MVWPEPQDSQSEFIRPPIIHLFWVPVNIAVIRTTEKAPIMLHAHALYPDLPGIIV